MRSGVIAQRYGDDAGLYGDGEHILDRVKLGNASAGPPHDGRTVYVAMQFGSGPA